ncbi:MAG TPA: class F sortase [Amycolatopsis sp.]|nr:class F sortase [Amycolatopsis sp.]
MITTPRRRVPRSAPAREPAGHRPPRALLLGLCVLVATVTGCSGAPVDSGTPVGSVSVMPAPATSTTSGAGMTRSDPVRLRIPRLDVSSDLVSLGVNGDGTVQVPSLAKPEEAGWYRFGPTPGQIGPAVILGHVDGGGHKGVFYDLKTLAAGDEVDVDRTDGTTARFRVDRLVEVPKDRFPTEAVYGNTDTPELRLITCGGSLDRAAHSYRDNIIVYADLE